MARQSDEERLAKQRERQKVARQQAARAKRPDRDDVARTALFWFISSMASKAKPGVLDEFQDRTVELLVAQGFDERASDEVMDELIAKYRTGQSPFRRKIHLLYPDGPPDASDLDD
jgi:hypothetical protein